MVILEVHCDACPVVKRYRVYVENPFDHLVELGWHIAGNIAVCPSCNEEGRFPEVRMVVAEYDS